RRIVRISVGPCVPERTPEPEQSVPPHRRRVRALGNVDRLARDGNRFVDGAGGSSRTGACKAREHVHLDVVRAPQGQRLGGPRLPRPARRPGLRLIEREDLGLAGVPRALAPRPRPPPAPLLERSRPEPRRPPGGAANRGALPAPGAPRALDPPPAGRPHLPEL